MISQVCRNCMDNELSQKEEQSLHFLMSDFMKLENEVYFKH